MAESFKFEDLPDGNDRFQLEECVGEGVYGKVYSGKDTASNGKEVAIKIQNYNVENEAFIQEEYRILNNFSNHENLPEFYGIFKNCSDNKNEVWFIMQLCSGGRITDLVNGLLAKNRRVSEEHLAFILKELVKVIIYLHQNKIMHRDLKGNNILLTKDGEIKLVDFGLSRMLASSMGKTSSCLGSPNWMAPEVVSAKGNYENEGYDNKADVWSLGIVAIELGDGKPPFQNMHPTRAMFQIVRNPPPTVARPAMWTELYNDFISECLVKNSEYRPCVMELLEHPFLEGVPEKTFHLTQELKQLSQEYSMYGQEYKMADCVVHTNLLKEKLNEPLVPIYVEDLAALDDLTENAVLEELINKLKSGRFCNFIGDILLILNPNEQSDIYTEKHHIQYKFKSRSANSAHIYSVADSAYQAALHHEVGQHILLSGESGSGKTTNYLHIVDHLLYLGQNDNINQERIKNAIKLIHAFVNASTPINSNSTRCIMHTQITYGESGKNSGALFEINQLEKWRISSTDMSQANFNILYYFYDGVASRRELERYSLDNDRNYRYLRVVADSNTDRPVDNPTQNSKIYLQIKEYYRSLDFTDEQIASVQNILSAILNLGNIEFIEENGKAEIKDEKYAVQVAEILKIDEKKFIWALKNYCIVNGNAAERKTHTAEEARSARDVLANTLYLRVVQFVVGIINQNLSYGRKIFGDKYSVKILDLFGFECFKENDYSQFLINCINEQLHYHYLQRIFAWEDLETNEEDIPYNQIYYYNNKNALNEMLSSSGVLNMIDTITKHNKDGKLILEFIKRTNKTFIDTTESTTEFFVNHYTGKVTYRAKEMPDKNRDFLPPELIDVVRSSPDSNIKLLFTSKLNKHGNLCLSFDEVIHQDSDDVKKQNYSQTKNIRTAASSFKAFCIKLLKELSIGGGAGGTHFVRCIRTDLENKPKNAHKGVIKQQLRALAVFETAKARQKGFAHRVPFGEFLKRYKFLAFDFDENVEITKDNCRLLLIRLKMEGWAIGKTKVFLKYYNEEYLSRLYESNVKKVIKIQSMIRSYLAKRRTAKKLKLVKQDTLQDEAATTIQNAFRNYYNRKYPDRILDEEQFDGELHSFIRRFYNKWRTKTIFQVLLRYRAVKFQEFYNLSQQVHLYNQNVFNILQQSQNVKLNSIDTKAQVNSWLHDKKPTVLKLPFRLDEVPYFDTSYMCEPSANIESTNDNDSESWDTPFQWRESVALQMASSIINTNESLEENKNTLIEIPFSRNITDNDSLDRKLSKCEEDNNEMIEINEDIKKELGKVDLETKSKKNITNIKIQEEKMLEAMTVTSTPANSDFEYIKPTPKKVAPKTELKNPIAELEKIGKNQITSEEDPPFNFQAMLRKTNYRRDSLKSSKDVVVQPQIVVLRKTNNPPPEFKVKKGKSSHNELSSMTEVSPGLYFEGVTIDL